MRVSYFCAAFLSFSLAALPGAAGETPARPVDFARDVQPLFEKNCYGCHGPKKQKGSFRLDRKSVAFKGGEERDIVPGKSAESPLIRRLIGAKPDEIMPPDGDPLSAEQIGMLRAWIDQGANWPDNLAGEENRLDWWSLKPAKRPVVPAAADVNLAKWVRTPIDAFIVKTLREKNLAPSPEADRRTLIRRLYFDLTGLPPTPGDTLAFELDSTPDAYEKIVDKLLASPRYGERWARHWMDAVHFGETHGHDQDRVRPNAWPYRDYLIEAFNTDKPYARFIQEQLAADALFPDEPQLTPALGFISAGPWDESSLRDIREDSICRQIGYYLDRDDMVTQTMSTFASSTVHCARCHDHKFDAITQHDYYALQAVFAGVGRANRAYDTDKKLGRQRSELQARLKSLDQVDAKNAESLLSAGERAEFEPWLERQRAAYEKLNAPPPWSTLQLVSATSKEGAQFTAQADGSLLVSGNVPETDIYTVVAQAEMKNITGVRLELLSDASLPFKGPGRQNENGNLHLTEFVVEAAPRGKPLEKKRVAIARAIADFNQTGWTIEHATDGKSTTGWGIHPEEGKAHWASFEFKEPIRFDSGSELTVNLEQQYGRKHLIGRFRLTATEAPHPAGKNDMPAELARIFATHEKTPTAQQRATALVYFVKERTNAQLAALPPPNFVYAGARDFKADGSHKPVDIPRPVNELRRGEIGKKGDLARPGALESIQALKGRFELADPNDEGSRRAALAQWLSAPANSLAWRSIVNRLWHYHFGRGIVNTPNDFGHMGGAPSHPELLDWLAAEFLESGGSMKKLHRLIVTSAVYRQACAHDSTKAAIDADNVFLWRMNRRRLDAECVHDAVLQVSGHLDLTMSGPSVQNFTLSAGPHVTPVVDYSKYEWNAPGSGRRSVYRFIFRTLPDPFMDALDCADASQLTEARNVSVTPLQALALLNDSFMLSHSEQLAKRIQKFGAPRDQIVELYQLALQREPTQRELPVLEAYAAKHGMENLCRMILNCSEFLFVD